MTNQEREDVVYRIAVINAQITDVESKTYRPMREISLGIDADGTALKKLTAYNDQIIDLREQLTELTTQLQEAAE